MQNVLKKFVVIVVYNVNVFQIINMDKLLINKYGNKVLYDTETNAIKNTPSDFDVRGAFFAK